MDAVTLFWGDNEFLLRLAAHEALERVGLRLTEIDARDWQGHEMSDLATPSLWGERRALLLLGAHALSEAALRELRAYMEGPSAEAIFMLTYVTRGKGPPALAKAVQAAGGKVVAVAIKRQDLARWVVGRAQGRQISLMPAGAATLVGTVGEDPAALDQAVIQLGSAFPGQAIGPDQVRSQFRGVGEQRVWDLCDLAFAGRLPEALRTLRSLLAGRDDPLLILGGIASRLRDLLKVKTLPGRMPPSEAARAAGLRFDWQVRRYREQAERFSLEDLTWLHEKVGEADRALKAGVPGDVLLPSMVAAMAGDREAALHIDVRVSR